MGTAVGALLAFTTIACLAARTQDAQVLVGRKLVIEDADGNVRAVLGESTVTGYPIVFELFGQVSPSPTVRVAAGPDGSELIFFDAEGSPTITISSEGAESTVELATNSHRLARMTAGSRVGEVVLYEWASGSVNGEPVDLYKTRAKLPE